MINFISVLIGNIKPMTSLSVLFAFLLACNHGRKSPNTTSSHENSVTINEFSLVSPETDQLFALRDSVAVTLHSRHKKTVIDSVETYLEGDRIYAGSIKGDKFSLVLPTSRVGRHDLRIRVFFNDSLSQSLSTRIISLANSAPDTLHYKLIRKYPHDSDAYIEGLVYNNGAFYESTGRKGDSKLREIDPATGKILMERRLDDEYFGEGITLFKGRIYQLTYTARVGFVYDLKTFELIRKFDLQTEEGWGLTNDGKSLIASDGTSTLYFYDPEYYSQTGQLYVADNKGLKNHVNELEYVNGYIWANVWGEDEILKIDANTGQVVAVVNLHNLVPKQLPDNMDYVLNGIAYNPESKTFYVTGKLWPVLYEISIY